MTLSVRPVAERVARLLTDAAADRRRRRDDARDEAERTRVPDRLRPTRQTEQRLQPDPVGRLHARGVLDDACVQAATDLCLAYVEAAGPVMARSQLGSLASGPRSRSTSGHPTLAQIARRERYVAWIQRLRDARCFTAVFRLVIDIVVEGRSVNAAARQRGWGYKRACATLAYGLGVYAGTAARLRREK